MRFAGVGRKAVVISCGECFNFETTGGIYGRQFGQILVEPAAGGRTRGVAAGFGLLPDAARRRRIISHYEAL